ncbi:MAG TPA: lipid-A-disaccharide synthase N-terminal domain-containing protein [Gemmatimonadaceae bacterium]|nr:lipid-A-disaccharide synthase N-terminal domain-containing protein [Gemmatimonadaceae bacterium]
MLLATHSLGIHGVMTAALARGADGGLPWPWLALGFAAQGAFAARFLVQWIASERAGASVVPRAFWHLSLVGSLALLAYFVRRGDPVGITGQLFGFVVYLRNLKLLARSRAGSAPAAGAPAAGD